MDVQVYMYLNQNVAGIKSGSQFKPQYRQDPEGRLWRCQSAAKDPLTPELRPIEGPVEDRDSARCGPA